jgi:hypothetical protein
LLFTVLKRLSFYYCKNFLDSCHFYVYRVNHEDKNDVYDIGVILLEIILGRSIMFHNEVGVLKDLVSIFSFITSNLISKLLKELSHFSSRIDKLNIWG